jgi:TolA-binding protein
VLARAAVCFALLVALALPGCVYYNTFYNAKDAAREAEALRAARPPQAEISSRENELLDRVVQKCSSVLRDHPDSGWADDALLLMGSALYHQGKHESAYARLSEFSRLYPDSESRPEADYLLGAVLIAKDDPVAAEDLLRSVADAAPPNEFSDDALILIGQARHSRGRYDEAAEAYLAALERFPDGGRRVETRILAAENYKDAGLLDAAAHQYEEAGLEDARPELAFEARARLADVRLEMGDGPVALAGIEELERRTVGRDDLDRVLLLKGKAYELLADLDAAISTYESVTASHERSDASALALYRVGLIRRDREENIQAAIDAFTKAQDESPRGEGSKLAAQALQDLTRFKGYLETIERASGAPGATSPAPDGADTLAAAGAPPGVVSDPEAHVSWIELAAAPDSAAVGSVEARPDSAAAGPVEARPDSAAAGPGSLPPPVAVTPSPGTAAGASDEEVANARFLLAELYLFNMDRPEKALGMYRDVLVHHESSPLAPKAGLAVAWILENRLGDPAGAALAYSEVLERHPDTDYARSARDALVRLGADTGVTR